MPAHNAPNKNRRFEMHILVVEKGLSDPIPDGHAQVTFEWEGGTHSWRIEGLLEPQTALLDPKHNWQLFDNNLPKGQGEAILRLLDWVQSLSCDA